MRIPTKGLVSPVFIGGKFSECRAGSHPLKIGVDQTGHIVIVLPAMAGQTCLFATILLPAGAPMLAESSGYARQNIASLVLWKFGGAAAPPYRGGYREMPRIEFVPIREIRVKLFRP